MVYETLEKFTKINLNGISDVELTKWIRNNVDTNHGKLNLSASYAVVKLIRESYRLGEIRGKSVK